MSSARAPRLYIVLSLLVIALSFVFCSLYFAVDKSDSFIQGVDHPFVDSFLLLYDELYSFGDTWARLTHPRADCLPSFFTVGAARLLGISRLTLYLVQLLGLVLLLSFGAAIARELTGQRWAGYLAAGMLAATPHVYYLAWSYNNWAYVAAFYLAAVYGCICLTREPSTWRAIGTGLAVALGQFSSHDHTTQDLFVCYCGLVVLIAFVHLAKQRRLSMWRWLGYLLLVALFAESVIIVREILWTLGHGASPGEFVASLFNNIAFKYSPARAVDYMNVISEHKFPPYWWRKTLPGYLYDLTFQALAPLLFGFAVLMFARFRRLKGNRFWRGWLLAPLLGLAVVSLIEKKNIWYILPLIPLVMTLAASVFVATAPADEKRRRAQVIVVFVLLAAQLTVFCWAWPPRLPAWIPHVMESDKNYLSCWPILVHENSQREMVGRTLAEFDRRLAPAQTIRLGVLDADNLVSVADFYFRAARRPIKLHLLGKVDPAQVDVVLWLVRTPVSDHALSLLAEPRDQLWARYAADLQRQSRALVGRDPKETELARYRAWFDEGEIGEIIPARLLLFPPPASEVDVVLAP